MIVVVVVVNKIINKKSPNKPIALVVTKTNKSTNK